ncbi:hypothetical protein JTE90_003530 [Oedothorax gibbosus]|uniref:Uncharacterized protein n=1 Tax=Oedothorax gibbosus TaxID=931172 RepID=A0AAV6UPF9_9ARAC|nr:hypothetical protein JTE90_003530 [Oedothorax gibbosus]
MSTQSRAPRITEHPSDVLVRKHEPATLNCKAEGRPTPVVRWFKGGTPVHDTPNRMLLPSGSLFFLHVMHAKDTGTYWCQAANDAGTARSRNVTLEVAVLRDDFRSIPKAISTAVGESAALECFPPKGHPEPIVRWRKDGEFIATTVKGRLKVVGPGNLVIAEVRQSDEGRYSCVAENLAGTRETAAVHVAVHVKPFFMKEPEHLTVLAGAEVSFPCKVDGDPMPFVKAEVTDDKSLTIKSVTVGDEGTYICEAENLVGSISSEVTLTVHSRPNFLVRPKDQRIGLNGIAKMECKATGNPPPSIFWTKEGNQVLMFPERSYGKVSVSKDGTLTISGVRKEDVGYYICSVLSGIGSSMAKAYLEMRDPRLVVLDSGTLQIDDLQPEDSGVYTCTASSESGETSWSAALTVASPRNPNVIFHKMADPADFPGPPSKPVATNISETSITLQWKKNPRMEASPVIGYTLEYYSSDLQSGWVVAAHNIIKETFVVPNLKPDTRYMFLVRAENKHGLGYPSAISDVMRTTGYSTGIPFFNLDEARSHLNDVTILLQDVVPLSSTSVKMTWKVQGASGFIEGFYIRFLDLSGGSRKYNMVTVLSGGSSTYTLGDLKKFTKYQFFLVPFYKSIEGPPSNSKTAQTSEDVPSAPPDNLQVRIVGPNSATISWSPPPPQHRNGMIQGYSIRVLDNSSHLHSHISTNASAMSLT